MKDSSLAESVGLTPAQLQKVFPYHVAVNEAFEIIQVGNKLMPTCYDASVIGTPISDIFDIKSPSNCAWTWHEIEINKNQTFHITLKPSILSHLKRPETGTLNLIGDLILQHHKQQSDSDDPVLSSPKGAIFLLHVNVSSTKEVKENEFNFHDTGNCSLHKEYIVKGTIF